MLKHTLGVSLVSVICLLSELTSPNAAWAATPDYICYIQIGSGQVFDLTHTVCRSHSKKAAAPAADNAVFRGVVGSMQGEEKALMEQVLKARAGSQVKQDMGNAGEPTIALKMNF